MWSVDWLPGAKVPSAHQFKCINLFLGVFVMLISTETTSIDLMTQINYKHGGPTSNCSCYTSKVCLAKHQQPNVFLCFSFQGTRRDLPDANPICNSNVICWKKWLSVMQSADHLFPLGVQCRCHHSKYWARLKNRRQADNAKKMCFEWACHSQWFPGNCCEMCLRMKCLWELWYDSFMCRSSNLGRSWQGIYLLCIAVIQPT